MFPPPLYPPLHIDPETLKSCQILQDRRPNLKNLSRVLNLGRAQIWLIPLYIVFIVSRFKPALN